MAGMAGQQNFNDLNLNKVNLLHFINKISYGSTPWITTFETAIPRCTETMNCHKGVAPDFSVLKGNRIVEHSLGVLARDSCKKLIALSACALGIQRDLLQHFPKYEKIINKKLQVIHPPQTLFVNDFSEKNISIDETTRLLFIGNSFFRKGGMEILQTLRRIKDKSSYDFNLIIISSLSIDNYARHEGPREVSEAKKMIHENSEWIKFYSTIPYHNVIELMKKSHLALLPTWADTYGFSVLECQASGCPVISTDVRALPEINNDEIGWVINVPKNRLGEAIYATIEQREIMKKTIEHGLEEEVTKILRDRKCILRKSKATISHIKKNHSPERYANKIYTIYKESG